MAKSYRKRRKASLVVSIPAIPAALIRMIARRPVQSRSTMQQWVLEAVASVLSSHIEEMYSDSFNGRKQFDRFWSLYSRDEVTQDEAIKWLDEYDQICWPWYGDLRLRRGEVSHD